VVQGWLRNNPNTSPRETLVLNRVGLKTWRMSSWKVEWIIPVRHTCVSVAGFGFEVSGLRFGVQGLGFRVSGFGIRVSGVVSEI